ncbi:MAG: M3 family metallopeptidase [Candidatus Eisenbacteria bacterium]
MRRALAIASFVSLVLAAPSAHAKTTMPDSLASNPLVATWTTPFGVPPFDLIKAEHYMPAFRYAFAEHMREVERIAGDPAPPTFANTIVALDEAGELLGRVSAVFGGLSSAETSPALQAVGKELAPLQSSHRDDILMNAKLFARVHAVWEQRAKLKLAPDQLTLLENKHRDFVRGGAQLGDADKAKLREINAKLAEASVKFRDNLLHDTNAFQLVLDSPAQLAGLPERVVAGAADAAKAAKLDGKWLFTLQAPSYGPFMQYASDRALRKQLFDAYTSRADHGDPWDNKPVIAQIVSLRAERAKLLGYATHADFVLAENMAQNPAAVDDLLQRLWKPSLAVAAREAADLQAAARADGQSFAIEPWDWAYYTEKIRQQRYAIDESELRPYFTLDHVREGVFRTANKLYGLTFTERKDLPIYHPEVRAFEVKDEKGRHLAIWYCDYHPRAGKRGGAWSGTYRGASFRGGKRVDPIVVNVCNFSRGAGGDPALLSMEETETLFHEFGHALHSMLSQVRYEGVARTPQDFVELPSQVMENWVHQDAVLGEFAKHWKTGAAIPHALIDKLEAASRFNQGFATTEYLAACLLDMKWHTLAAPVAANLDVAAFERDAMTAYGMPSTIVPRYKSTYFQHVFAGGYSSGYYSYVWAEVLDADAFEAFREKGIFDPATSRAFRTQVLEKGGSEDAMLLYERFRGRKPSVEPLLERRGLK